MTLLELTIVISTILGLLSILFVGSRAWKRGSDRACCVLTLRDIQVAARSYQNLCGYDPGGRPRAEYGTRDIARHLYEKDYIGITLYEHARGIGTCPGRGTYTRPHPDVFPETGELYMNCSLAVSNAHQPGSHADW